MYEVAWTLLSISQHGLCGRVEALESPEDDRKKTSSFSTCLLKERVHADGALGQQSKVEVQQMTSMPSM